MTCVLLKGGESGKKEGKLLLARWPAERGVMPRPAGENLAL